MSMMTRLLERISHKSPIALMKGRKKVRSSQRIAQVQADAAPAHSTILADYTRERAAFARQKSELLSKHHGKYVVFVGEDMLGPYDTFPTALTEAYRKYGLQRIYTKKLVADDSV